MPEDAATLMKERLRADLLDAMRQKQSGTARLIRGLVAAIDNAQAPAMRVETTQVQHDFRDRSAEVPRMILSAEDIRRVLLAERDEREQAAASLEALGKATEADLLRTEILLIGQYLGPAVTERGINGDDGSL